MESHQPEFLRILLEGGFFGKLYFRVAQHVFRHAPFPFDAFEFQVLLRPDHEEGFQAVDPEKLRKGVVAPVKHIVRAGFVRDGGHGLRVMDGCRCNMVEGRDMRLQIIEHVRLDAAFPAAELRPVEHGKAQWDGRGIEGVDLSAKHEDVCRAFSPDLVHHEEGVLFKDMVVPVLVGDRKRVPRGGAGAEAEMVAFRLVGVKHGGEVAKTLAAAQLPEHQRE